MYVSILFKTQVSSRLDFIALFKNCCGIHKIRISAYTIGNLSNYIDIRARRYLSNFQLLHMKKHPVFSISISNGLQAMFGYKYLRGIKQWNYYITNDIIWKLYSYIQYKWYDPSVRNNWKREIYKIIFKKSSL